ncbi:MAG: Holliday junction resolvase RuvX [Candidatus Paceibacterota bacterium]
MKLLGIDYGTKRVGIATADTDAGMAFPKLVVKNDDGLVKAVKDICEKEKVEKIILGESKDLEGKDNLIAEDIKEFKIVLEKETGLTVIYEPEFYTSMQAARLQGENDMIDASAATIILQSYMDKFKG